MKIFVTILAATITALATADISLISGSNYHSNNNNNNSPQPYSRQQHQQQQQITSKPSLTYLPQLEEAGQFSHHPAVKPARRYRPRTRIIKKPIVTKNFYLHSAPDDTEDEIQEELAAWQQQPRKHYNVLFVKAPSQTNKAAALNLAKSLKQEKTIVYVLAKKTSAAELQDAVAETPQGDNKPEVFFIKYRTAEEAANAQRQIQSQYDSLGGITTITDEGIAPSTSVIGSLDASEEEEEEEGGEEEEGYNQNEQQHQQLLENSQETVHSSEQHLANSAQTSTSNVYLPPQF